MSVPSVVGEGEEDVGKDELWLQVGRNLVWWNAGRLERELAKHSVRYSRVAKPSTNSRMGWVSFEDAVARDAGGAAIRKIQVRGRALQATELAFPPPPDILRVRQQENRKRPRAKRLRGEEEESSGDEEVEGEEVECVEEENDGNARDSATPWWREPYEQQVDRKRIAAAHVMIWIVQHVRRKFRQAEEPPPAWLSADRHPVFFGGFEPCPEPTGYRNKCEFTVGVSREGRACVGFHVNSGGVGSVEPPYEVCSVSKTALVVAAALQEFVEMFLPDSFPNVRTSPRLGTGAGGAGGSAALGLLRRVAGLFWRSPGEVSGELAELRLAPYDGVTHCGFWRSFAVRNTLKGEAMVCVQVQETEAEREAIPALQRCLVGFLRSRVPQVVSVYWQHNNEWCGRVQGAADEEKGRSREAAPAPGPLGSKAGGHGPQQLLYGESHLEEALGGIRLRYGPDSFFQVNVATTELLFAQAAEWGECGGLCGLQDGLAPNPLTSSAAAPRRVALDVFCGVGAIGLACARGADALVGVEIIEGAVADARVNAALNGMRNAIYVCGQSDRVLSDAIKMHTKERDGVVVFVDPPRPGLGHATIRTLRKCARISRLVYISCNSKTFRSDAVRLCGPGPKKVAGKPFELARVRMFDMFPHTPHFETCALFVRGAEAAALRSRVE